MKTKMLNKIKVKNSLWKTIFLLVILHSSVVFSQDLGVFGQVYPITEQDFLEFIQSRLADMKKTGEWNRIENQFRENVKNHADRQMPVKGITPTIQSKTWDYDPSIQVPYDLHDNQGKIFAKAGTIINPLQWITLHKVLLFFDGDDKKQVSWAERINAKYANHTKMILVKGSILDLEKRILKPVYFDQEGRLSNRFHIQHVPAIVQQKGLLLNISEVLP